MSSLRHPGRAGFARLRLTLALVVACGASACGPPPASLPSVPSTASPPATTPAVAAPARPRGNPLSYSRTTGQAFHFEIHLQAAPLSLPPLDARAIVSERTVSTTSRLFQMQSQLRVLDDSDVEGEATGTYDVSPAGAFTRLASSRLDDPIYGAFLRDLRLLYPPLPDAAVEPGITWTGVLTLHLPMFRIPIPLPPVVTHTRFRFAGLEGPAERPIARLDLLSESAPGQFVTARLRGFYRMDARTGLAQSALLTGTVDAHRLMIPDPFPVTLTVSTADAPGVKPRLAR